MHYIMTNNQIEIIDALDFDPVKIFECGQCFRWNADGEGVYTGVFRGHAAKVFHDGDRICIRASEGTAPEELVDYFDLDRNYEEIRRSVAIDSHMRSASDFGKGIRILRQDPWEALCSFIVSQCNNIPRIKKIIESLCLMFGEPICFEGRTLHTFPSADTLAGLSSRELEPIRCGYRAEYIIGAARAVSCGALDLGALARSGYDEALRALKTLNGVGDKVANCVILFGLNMLGAFPIDVWMKKTLAKHYGDGFSPSVFGEYAGVAQQYMFFYARFGEK